MKKKELKKEIFNLKLKLNYSEDHSDNLYRNIENIFFIAKENNYEKIYETPLYRLWYDRIKHEEHFLFGHKDFGTQHSLSTETVNS